MSISLPSCLPKSPLIELEDSSNPPILKYSLPESTAITAYSIEPMELEINISKFTALAQKDYTPPAPVNPISGQNPSWRFEPSIVNPRPGAGANILSANFAGTPDGVSQIYNAAVRFADTTKATNLVAVAARNVEQGYAIVAESSFGGYTERTTPVKRTTQISPGFFFVEEIKLVSFLGNYGAGKTLETMTLLPGEKRKITVKTFKEITSLQSRSENVIDSFSQSSANEFEKYVENENSVNLKLSASVKTKATAKARIKVVDVQGEVETSFSASRESNVRNLNKAMNKHVESSNKSRQVDINTNTQNTYKETEENYLEREFENINRSRCLNFVFRQMLQEYITVTYLDDVKIAFSNGHTESYAEASLTDLDKFLLEYVNDPTTRNQIKIIVDTRYLSARNYLNQMVPFYRPDPSLSNKLVKTVYTDQNPVPAGQTVVYVQGPVLNIETHILKSAGVIGEALLGQGEALDCYNMRLQDLAYQEKHLKTQLMSKALDAADGLNGEEKARYLAQLSGAFMAEEAKTASGLDILAQAKNEGLPSERRAQMFGGIFNPTIIR